VKTAFGCRGGATISGKFNGLDTILTYPGGTLNLVGIDLGPHGLDVAKDYPWLEWSDSLQSTDISATSDDPNTAGLSHVDEPLNLIGVDSGAVWDDWFTIA
jgi:hypothetical protein